MIDWHRLFGLTLMDLFTDSPYVVELEKDLSLKQQLLDVVIIEQGEGEFTGELPDGLEDLGRHNLLTYKSLRQPFDAWTIDELVGHYVNYRKQISPSLDNLLPVEDFRLYGVCTREPQKLQREIPLTPRQEGVYEVQWGIHRIRIIVLSQIPETPKNAIWQLFSGIPEHAQYGAAQYHWRRTDHSGVINQLYYIYCGEEITMAYTWEDFYRDSAKETLKHVTIEDVLQLFSPEELLKQLSPEDVLKILSSEELLEKVNADDLEAVLKKLRQKQKTQQNN